MDNIRTCLGMVTFGNLNFTKLALEESLNTTKRNRLEPFVIIGKPDDFETRDYLEAKGIPYVMHKENFGFPYSLNDIYDYFLNNNFNNLIIQGNDVIPYPYAIDLLIEIANNEGYEWVSAREYSVKNLVDHYPETRRYFSGTNLVFTDFTSRPWDGKVNMEDKIILTPNVLADCQNLNLYSRSCIDKLGYTDVNFYPAYFVDNDFVQRALQSDIKSCSSFNSIYFHFWSRTIHQGKGGSTDRFFSNNSAYYNLKWGGSPSREPYKIPFNGNRFLLGGQIELPMDIKISTRIHELEIINYWKTHG